MFDLDRGSAATTRHALPWDEVAVGSDLLAVARRLVRERTGREAAWVEQLGAYSDTDRHPSGAGLSVAFIAALRPHVCIRDGTCWEYLGAVQPESGRQRRMLAEGMAVLRARADSTPIAFKLLSTAFTLGELQLTFELLLGRSLHKASFRRALRAAQLVEPTGEWRQEGRGRPAKLFRYAPTKQGRSPRTFRFDRIVCSD
ncbi:MAG: hypothetical protein MNPFHGCM_00076 [Gemmatimonadaceae bacterium]|nr:hypothetical protein [Gemmatimonadaceae bacterium]